ncbi:MAG TPA: type II secretion system protein [Phycisphaerales bacterium]|nr:type II secretion system protein [Phycisphaerales bacterium]
MRVVVWAQSEEIIIRVRERKTKTGRVEGWGFTLIELLVVISISSVLMAVLVPSLGKVRRQARALKGMNNQKGVASALNLFAADNDDRYPESVATVGESSSWNWSDPTRLTGAEGRTPASHRAMSEYLRSYIPDASSMYCPNAPHKHRYLQQAWDAGDAWDNPDTPMSSDLLGGTYCFYWNYRGFLPETNGVFRGPRGPASGGRRFSKLLVTDYFGYDHWRMQRAYGSCEPFRGAGVLPETSLLSAYWSRTNPAESTPEFKLRAGYTDGHVETYSPSDVAPMKVSISRDGTVPYPDGTGFGTIFLPRNAVN